MKKAPKIDWKFRPVVYRFYATDGEPVYYGSTRDWARRLRAHRSKQWWPLVARVKITLHPSMSAAGTAEIMAIDQDRPLFNIAVPREGCSLTPHPWHLEIGAWSSKNIARLADWRRAERENWLQHQPAKIAQ